MSTDFSFWFCCFQTSGALGQTRTADLLLRRQVLCPIELRARNGKYAAQERRSLCTAVPVMKVAERVGFEPTVPAVLPDTPVFETGAIDHSATSPLFGFGLMMSWAIAAMNVARRRFPDHIPFGCDFGAVDLRDRPPDAFGEAGGVLSHLVVGVLVGNVQLDFRAQRDLQLRLHAGSSLYSSPVPIHRRSPNLSL